MSVGAGASADEVNHNVRVVQLDARAELRVQVTLGGATQTDENASTTAGAAAAAGVNKNGSAVAG
jgi:hypothetical protein